MWVSYTVNLNLYIILISVLLLHSESERALKRPHIDKTATICRELMSKLETIPTRADQLEPFINAQLLCKLPASNHEDEKVWQSIFHIMLSSPALTVNSS